jgi:hypothetical protein
MKFKGLDTFTKAFGFYCTFKVEENLLVARDENGLVQGKLILEAVN